LRLAAEPVEQGRFGLAEQGALDHHIAEALALSRLVLVTGKSPVGGRERVGELVDVGAVGEVGNQVVVGADGRSRIDEGQCLAAGLIDRPIIGRAGEVLGPRRRADPMIDVAGYDHQRRQQACQDPRRRATARSPAMAARARKGAAVARYW
jgi:hypothetical protein